MEVKMIGRFDRGGGNCLYWICRSQTNNTLTLKRYNFLRGNEGVPVSIIREISFLKEMAHPNIIRLLDVQVNEDKRLCLEIEYMEHTLRTVIDKFPEFARNPHVIKSYLHQILSGLAYCHTHKILHRDLKPENLLIDSTKRILKIADFGAAREFGVPANAYTDPKKVAGQRYKAPELLLNDRNYSTPVDIWSVGCIFAEMVLQRPLFTAEIEVNQLIQIFRILGTPTEETWPGANSLYDSLHMFAHQEPENLAELVPGLEQSGFDLLSKMLCLNPRERLTADEALMHPYFADVERP